jgi:hypothetical protein
VFLTFTAFFGFSGRGGGRRSNFVPFGVLLSLPLDGLSSPRELPLFITERVPTWGEPSGLEGGGPAGNGGKKFGASTELVMFFEGEDDGAIGCRGTINLEKPCSSDT